MLGAAAVAALGAAAAPAAPVRRAQAQVADAGRHGPLLGAFLAAWNARDVEGVVRLFTDDAAVFDAGGHYAFAGAPAVRDWVRGSLRSGQALSGTLEAVAGERGTWRLSGSTTVESTLGLPPVEFLADVRLRSGGGEGRATASDTGAGGGALIAALAFRDDPQSRERYSRAVATVQAGLPAPGAPTPQVTNAGGPGTRTGDTPAPTAVTWFAGGAALLLAAAAAAWPRRRGR